MPPYSSGQTDIERVKRDVGCVERSVEKSPDAYLRAVVLLPLAPTPCCDAPKMHAKRDLEYGKRS
jgi:hypothetical protein